jgi:hypothetical protein
MSASRSRWIFRALQFALLVAVAGLVWRSLAPDLGRMRGEDFWQWRPALAPLVLSFLMVLLVYSAHALLWRRIMVDLQAPRPSLRTTFRVYFLASLGRYVPGKLWQLAGLAVLAQRAGLPPGTAMGAALLGQFAFLTTGLLLLALLLPSYAEFWPALIGTAAIAAAAATMYALVATPLGHRAREAVLRRAAFARARLASAFAIADRVRFRHAVRWELLYAATWLLLGLAFAVFVSAFVPAIRSLDGMRFLAGVLAASYLAGYVVVVMPAGVGVREATMTLLLTQHAAMPASAAVVVTVASRIWFTAAELLPLVLVPLLPDGAAPRPVLDSEAMRTP